MNRLLLSILFFVSTFSVLNGQDISVSAAFDSSKIFIGDQIYYTITVDQPQNVNLDIKALKDTLCKNVEILAGPVQDTSISADKRLKIESKYLITSFDSGFYQIPPVYAEIKNENGIKRFYSDYSRLEVMRVRIAPADTTLKIFDIIKPYRAPLTVGEILPWVLLGIAGAAIIWGIILLICRFRKSKNGVVPVIDPEPAHITAFRDLEKLRDEQLWQKGEIKLYYSRLTEILRIYLENRYRVCSLEMTTSETLAALVKKGFRKDDSYTDLKTILTGSDLVKFAKYKPEPSENDIHFGNTWKFVENTKIEDEISEPADMNLKKEGIS